MGCRLPVIRLPFSPAIKATARVECPNCKRVKVQDKTQEKAVCPVCGNVWAWARRRRGIVSLLRRVG